VFELAIRVVFSLAVVFGLIWLVARTSSRKFGGAARSMVRVVARQPLARTASLAVVEVGDRVLVVGVSENGVSLLTEMDPSELPAADTAAETGDPTVETAALTDGSGRAAGSWLRKPAGGPDQLVPVTPAPGAHAAVRSTGLNGSVLSAQTWRQAWAAATSRNGVASE
jgi:flagellar protein FliO/FliZ